MTFPLVSVFHGINKAFLRRGQKKIFMNARISNIQWNVEIDKLKNSGTNLEILCLKNVSEYYLQIIFFSSPFQNLQSFETTSVLLILIVQELTNIYLQV